MSEAAPQMEGYTVSEACIACDACCDDFPEVFKMNVDHTRAIAYVEAPKGKFDPWDIIYVCPVDAISLIKGELPPPPTDKKPKSHTEETPAELPPAEDNRPWEIRWAEAQKRGPESDWERMKRYGMAATMEETMGQYLFRVALPDSVPEHPLKYKWNLPNKMPDYKFDVKLNREGHEVSLKGWLEDDRIRKLSGVANSFPDRFLRKFELHTPAKEVKFNYNPKDKILDVIVDKSVN